MLKCTMFLKNPVKTLLARNLRKNQTPTEEIVWESLRNRKYRHLKFRRQFVIDGFILDFYSMKLKLAIELDGKIHLKQKEYDSERQLLIENHNEIKFIRITNEEIQNNPEIVLKKIDNFLKTTKPSLSGEGGRAAAG